VPGAGDGPPRRSRAEGGCAAGGALGFRARAGEVTLAGTRLGAAFESLVRYGKERGELSATVDEEEAAAMLSVVTAEAVIRWGAGNRSTSWLRQTLRDRAEVVLRGINRADDGYRD
jgi:hypothetical protein